MRRKAIAFTITALAVGAMTASVSSERWFLMAFVLTSYGLLLLLFHRLYNLLNWVDPTVMFVVSYITFIGMGITTSGWYHVILTPSSVFAVIVGLALFLGGAVTSDIIATPPGRIKIPRSVKSITTYHSREILWAWMFFLVGIFTLLYYYYDVGTVPFLSENAENIRLLVKAGRGYLPVAGFALLSVSTAVLTAAYAKRHRIYLFAIILVVVTAAVLLLGVGYRILSVRILLNSFIIYSFIRKSKISGVTLIGFTVIIVALLSVAGFYRLFGHPIQSLGHVKFALSRSAYAIFVRYLYVFDLVMTYFPDVHPFMLGQGYLMSASTLMPGSQPHFGFWLAEHLGLTLTSIGPVDPTILGEFYANFGWIGIVTGMFALGAVSRVLYRFFNARLSPSVDAPVLMTLFSTSLMGLVGSGVVLVVLFDTLPLIAVFAAYRLCVQLTRAMLRPNRAFVRSVSVKS